MNIKSLFFSLIFLWSLISCSDKVLDSPTKPADQTKTPGLKSASISYYVAKTGSDNNSGTLTSPWLTISHAVTKLVAGDILYARAGTYNEAVTIDNSGTASSRITITNYPGESPIINGGGSLGGNGGALIRINGSYVTVSNLEISNSSGNGVLTLYGGNVTLTNLNVHGCSGSGVLFQADYSICEDSHIWNNSLCNYTNPGTQINASGISAARSPNYCTIRRCTVNDNWGEGLSTFNATHTTIEDNSVYDNWSTNIYISDATYVLCQRNFVYTTKVLPGVLPYGKNIQNGILMGDETGNPTSANNTIINNICYGNCRNFEWWGSNVGSGMNNFLIANNTFVNARSFPTSQGFVSNIWLVTSNCVNTQFKNNIIYQSDASALTAYASGSTSGLYNGKNLWLNAPLSTYTYLMGTGDVISDPKLTNVSQPNVATSYSLSSTSPAINAGVNVGLTTDYLKNAISGLPDIGAIEYQGTSTATTYYNIVESGTAAKNNCTTGSTGSTVTYTVAAGKYSSTISQADADNKAIADVTTNKQAYANANGTCTTAATTYYSTQESGTATKNDCTTGSTGSTVTYTVAAGKYTSTVSQVDADNKAIADVTTNKQAYANANGTCMAATVYYNVQESGTATKNTCGPGYTGSTLTYTVAAGKYSSTISQTEANNKAITDVTNNKQAYANANGTCMKKKWWRR